jgi:hypothetical protein
MVSEIFIGGYSSAGFEDIKKEDGSKMGGTIGRKGTTGAGGAPVASMI